MALQAFKKVRPALCPNLYKGCYECRSSIIWGVDHGMGLYIQN